MIDINQIKENYKKSSTIELIELSKTPNELREEIIPILRNELLHRNEHNAVNELDLMLAGPRGSVINLETQESLLQEIEQRMELGEPIESIRIDLEERGFNISEIYSSDSIYKKENFSKRLANEVASRRLADETYDNIKFDVLRDKNLTEEQITEAIDIAKANGKKKKERGTTIIFICLLVTLATIVFAINGEGNKIWLPVGPILLGVYFISSGKKQSTD